MDPATTTVAAGAVAVLAPYLAEAGKAVAKKGGEAAWEQGRKLLALVRARFARPEQQAALAELEAAPADEDARGALRLQLRKAMEADPDLLAELAALLKSLPASGGQTATLTGDGNIVGQADRGSSVIINR